jgi:hypothetical protein
MSKTMTSAVASGDHFSHLTPKAGGLPERSTPVSLGKHDGARLHELVEQMRQSVVTATLATDIAAKIKLWELYRMARTEAIAMIASAPDKLRTGHAQRAQESSVA